MTKRELAEVICKSGNATSINKAEQMITAVSSAIASSLTEGNGIQIVGLGNFKIVTKKASTARNPRTGEAINIPEHKVVKFAVSKAITDKLNA